VGHHDHGPAFFGQALDHFRLHRQRAGNRHALLLATREKRRLPLFGIAAFFFVFAVGSMAENH